MKVLQDAMDRTLGELPERLLTELLAQKLEVHGIKLSPRERASLTKRILANEGKYVHQGWKWWDRREIQVDLVPADLDRIASKVDDFTEKILPEMIESLTGKLCAQMLADLKRQWPKESRIARREMAGFRKRLYGRWKVGLERLHMLLTICREVGGESNQDLSRSHNFAKRRHLAGPSNAGLADPAHGAAVSLVQVTAVFVSQQPTLDANVVLRMIPVLAEEVGEAFGDAHERLADDEARLQAAERQERGDL